MNVLGMEGVSAEKADTAGTRSAVNESATMPSALVMHIVILRTGAVYSRIDIYLNKGQWRVASKRIVQYLW